MREHTIHNQNSWSARILLSISDFPEPWGDEVFKNLCDYAEGCTVGEKCEVGLLIGRREFCVVIVDYERKPNEAQQFIYRDSSRLLGTDAASIASLHLDEFEELAVRKVKELVSECADRAAVLEKLQSNAFELWHDLPSKPFVV
ncbi:MAG: hypothetical protein ACYS0K_23580, partial [Planctomycetota bacterium]